VPLIEGVLDRSGVMQLCDTSGSIQRMQLLPSHTIQMRKDKPSAQDVIVPLVRMLVQQGEKVIVFRNQRGTAEGCAAYLSRELGLPPAEEVTLALLEHDLSTTSATLRMCLHGGTAFHDTNLTREERTVVEQTFRDPDSHVRVLSATSTMAAGINTPASTVILAEQEFVGEDGRPFTIAEYKNMAGRAGRLGFNEAARQLLWQTTAMSVNGCSHAMSGDNWRNSARHLISKIWRRGSCGSLPKSSAFRGQISSISLHILMAVIWRAPSIQNGTAV